MKSLKKFSLIIVAAFISMQATHAGITCYTPNLSKKLEISENTIAITKPYLAAADRALASISSIRTKFKANGFDKILYANGEKHTIHIEDQNSFSEINDYLVIRTSEGHEMTFPLTCE